MRLRNVPEAPAIIEASDFCVKNAEENKGKWKDYFGQNNPLHIEVGMGKGQFILSLAEQNPNINYIGIERYESVLYKAVRVQDEKKLPNLRFMCIDAEAIENYFEEGEVDRIYLNFSDPWPKDRHAKRRLTSPLFLDKWSKVVKKDGTLEFKTDNRGLFDYSVETVKEHGIWDLKAVTYDLHHDEVMNVGNIMTEYEAKFSAKGNPINKLIAENSK